MAEDAATTSANPVTDAIIAALKAVTGDSLKGLAPTRAVEGASFQATIAAYRALAIAAADIVEMTKQHSANAVLVSDSPDLPDLIAYRTFIKAAQILSEEIKTDLDTPEQVPDDHALHFLPIGLIGPAISAGLALASFLLHRDVKQSNAAITLDSRALVLLTSKALRVAGIEPADIASLSFSLTDTAAVAQEGRLRERLEMLEKQGADLREKLGGVTQRLDPKAVDKASSRLAALKARFEGTLKGLATFEEATAKNLSQLVRGDEINAFLAKDGAVILTVQILAAGGSTRTESISLRRDRIEHSGGIIAGGTLRRPDGIVLANELFVRHIRTQENNSDELLEWHDDGI